VRQGIRFADGRGPATTLYDRICGRLGVEGTPDLVDWFYDQELARPRVAELARLVEEAAADGDLAAEELLDQAAGHLARAARAVVAKLTFDGGFPLVLSGGAFRACPSLPGRIEARLLLPQAKILRLEAEPATGAVRLAQQLLDRPESTPSGAAEEQAGEPSRWRGE
jgi:N-acetylglucosamine kinase-like BadF-type ATPase